MKAVKGSEIVVSVDDRVGALGEITSALKKEGLNIRAISGWIQQQTAVIRVVTSDNQKAKEALSQFEVNLEDAVVVDMSNEVGQLDSLSDKLQEAGVNMTHIYGTTSGQGEAATLIFSSDNDQKAIEAISA
ncbi:MAG: ACT domain-containing protein [Candidatus Omnitrophica bacterium]|nr:ACT domain-containing protein [Candidatus Omnitrophota bacterium]